MEKKRFNFWKKASSADIATRLYQSTTTRSDPLMSVRSTSSTLGGSRIAGNCKRKERVGGSTASYAKSSASSKESEDDFESYVPKHADKENKLPVSNRENVPRRDPTPHRQKKDKKRQKAHEDSASREQRTKAPCPGKMLNLRGYRVDASGQSLTTPTLYEIAVLGDSDAARAIGHAPSHGQLVSHTYATEGRMSPYVIGSDGTLWKFQHDPQHAAENVAALASRQQKAWTPV
jgi:hypothetical protein